MRPASAGGELVVFVKPSRLGEALADFGEVMLFGVGGVIAGE
jgi:hypothetical protein